MKAGLNRTQVLGSSLEKRSEKRLGYELQEVVDSVFVQ